MKLRRVKEFFFILALALLGAALLFGCESEKREKRAIERSVAPKPTPVPGSIAGVVFSGDETMPGAAVYLYRDARSGFRGAPAYMVERAGSGGSFRIEVKPGAYYAMARKGGEYFGFFGGNPVRVASGQERRILLAMARQRPPDPSITFGPDAAGSGLRGVVYAEDRPLGGAEVAVFQDAETSFAGKPFRQVPADDEGRFRIELPPGEYYLLAQKRREGREFGAIEVGDHYCYHGGNPVRAPLKKYLDVALSCVRRPDGPPGGGGPATIPVTGRVLDERGRPAAGIYVGAYGSPAMTGEPRRLSLPTGKDGRFVLKLPGGGGKYYLVGRSTFAGPPLSGELLGLLRGADDSGVLVTSGGKLEGIEIVVRPVP